MKEGKRPFGAVLLVALLLFTASLLFIERRLERLTNTVVGSGTDATFSLFQTRFELERLMHALDRALAGQETDLRRVRTRFDIFWSRIELLRTGADTASVRALPGGEAVVATLRTVLERHGEEFGQIPPTTAAMENLRAELAPLQLSLQELVLAMNYSSALAQSSLQQQLGELGTAGWVSLGGLLLSTAILVGLLYREAATTRRLLARTEESRARIEHLAHHDALTGLPNRRLFEDRLVQALAVAARARRRLALLYLDLDGFKDINDSLGHRAGDELLKSVAERLRRTVRGGDTIARLGGDEFAVIQVELRNPSDAAILAERLMAAAATPTKVGQHELVIGASIGVALFPDDGSTADELRANADVALYSAKSAGRARMAYYRPELTQEVRTRGALRRELARGIEAGELELHYQPKISSTDGTVAGLEALLRWQHPHRGLLSPALFVPLAEETGLIRTLGDWVLANACQQIGHWKSIGIVPPRIAINLSAAQLRHGSVASRLRHLIEEADIPPALLELELTESVLLDDDPRVHHELEELRRLGVAIALDDFGTGYSSLSYLHRLHLRTVKIDRSLISQFGDHRAETICSHVVRLAHDLGLVVVAEGIETWRHAEIARSIGFDELQGYWFARPAPVAEITGHLRGKGTFPLQPASNRLPPLR